MSKRCYPILFYIFHFVRSVFLSLGHIDLIVYNPYKYCQMYGLNPHGGQIRPCFLLFNNINTEKMSGFVYICLLLDIKDDKYIIVLMTSVHIVRSAHWHRPVRKHHKMTVTWSL